MYEEENCHTKHEEKCEGVSFKSCRLVPTQEHKRKCETVEEEICHLKMSYINREIASDMPKQKCRKTTSK